MPRRPVREDGIALISVIGATFAVSLLIAAAVNYAARALPQTLDHEDWNAALAAAEAGVDDLLYRLNQNPNYWSLLPDEGNVALNGWRPLSGGDSAASYTYSINADEVGRTGAVDVISTGRVGDQTRTVEVRLRRRGFLDAIYFTDYESSDPFAIVSSSAQRTHLDSYCARYHPFRDKSAARNSPVGSGGCGDIRFAPGDVLEGPTISNDALLIRPGATSIGQGPRFLGTVETGWDGRNAAGQHTGRLWLRDNNSSGEPFFQDGIVTQDRLAVPTTSATMKQQAMQTGCLYQGPTYIRFRATGQPRMTVVSPRTTNANPGCVGTDLPLKDGEVLYVDNSTGSPSSHPLGMPRANDVTAYSRTAGDAFVHGTLDGQVTVAAANDVVIVHDLLYADRGPSSDDLLGLIADNRVSIYHPVSSSGSNGTNLPSYGSALPPFNRAPGSGAPAGDGVVWTNARVDGALLALNRSFWVQNYGNGAPLGTLSVHGAIAQRWRGPVATAHPTIPNAHGSGYLKDYVYDDRLTFLTPPYFLEPERSPWERRRWVELTTPDTCTSAQTPLDDGCVPPASP